MSTTQIVAAWAATCTLAATTWIIASTRRQRRRIHPEAQLAWLAWHWATGGPLVTSRSYTGAGIGRRIAVGAARTTSTVTVGWIILVAAGNQTATLADSATLAGILAAVAAVAAHLAARTYAWVHWARPLGNAVGKAAAWPDHIVAEWMVHLPRDMDRGRPKIRMGAEWEPRQSHMDRVEEICRSVLGLRDATAEWHVTGWRNYLRFAPPKLLPDRVPFSDPDVRELVESAAPSAPLLGLTRDAVPVARDFDSDSPHVIVSATTGAGKSSVLRSIVAQIMWHDPTSEILVLDAKRHSHSWIRGIEGVTYARDATDIHDALVAAGEEGRARNRACDDLPLGAAPPFPRKLIVCEELNGTMTWLTAWWDAVRRPGDPKTSPAVQALREILFMGRAVRIHIVGAAQQATARALGGGEARENFALRILSGYSANTWKMLVPHLDYTPARSHPGWAMVCHGRDAIETQTVWITDKQARAFVLERRSETSPTVTNRAKVSPPADSHSSGNQPPNRVHEPYGDSDDPIDLITLREAVEGGVLRCTLKAANGARTQDPEFPEPVVGGGRGTTARYWADALTRWERNRPRTKSQAHDPIVYFIAVGDRVKIGTTTNLERRLDAFALHPDDVVCTVPGDRDVEHGFHRRWAGLRIHDDREWFRAEGDLAAWLDEHRGQHVVSLAG